MTLLEERVSRVNGKPNLCRLVVEVCLIAVRPYESFFWPRRRSWTARA
jgi:hypothetical protein